MRRSWLHHGSAAQHGIDLDLDGHPVGSLARLAVALGVAAYRLGHRGRSRGRNVDTIALRARAQRVATRRVILQDVEGADAAQVEGTLNFPVGGRIAVIVYAAIGGAAPRLSAEPAGVRAFNGQQLPQLTVRNAGNAHGRLQGFVNGRDADGKRIELAPADTPILPGETRQVALLPMLEEGAAPITIRYPLQVQGQLESGSERLPLDLRFAP